MNLDTLKTLYKAHKEPLVFGRYITLEHLIPVIEKHIHNFKIETIGTSVLGKPIQAMTIGNGKKRIFMWSQMHGNETTTTKAVFDLCNVLSGSDDPDIKNILDQCQIGIIPMLNPDGAHAYTRLNSNSIDLNRDAQQLSQPESLALRRFFEQFRPDLCFNLHGQRSIFSAGKTHHPATVSFLAPAQDRTCAITKTRQKAMEIIVRMNDNLQVQIPNQVGVYDDTFNLNCVGDTFQALDVPTVLFEAGHYANDYRREVVREFIFQSLLVGIHHFAKHPLTGDAHKAYLNIPQNEKLFYDVIIRDAVINDSPCDIALQYQETLKAGAIEFVPSIEKIGDLNGFYGHREIDALGKVVRTLDNQIFREGPNLDNFRIGSEIVTIKVQ